MNGKYFGDDDLILNTASRIPVCLCLDVSGSMSDCIDELNEGVNAFYESVRKSETACMACEIAVVTFSSDVQVYEDYSTVDKKSTPHLYADGGTCMTEGVEKSLELLDARKAEYKANGVDYYQPWLVIMSDGEPNDRKTLRAVQSRVKALESEKKLVVFAIGIGNYVDMNLMDEFSRKKAKRLKGFNFEEFFEWLGKSVSIVSTSQVGDTVKLDMSTLDDWAEI